jgi:uncharacterized membrane protein YphA (DoxX/SURF4 family)
VTTLWTTLHAFLHRRLFAPITPASPALLRAALGLFLLGRHTLDLTWVTGTTGRAAFLGDPTPLVAWLLPFPLPGEARVVYTVVYLAAAACCAVGLFGRVSLVFFTAIYVVTAAYGSSWGIINHASIAIAYALIFLSLSPGADRFTLDRLLRWAWRRRRGEQTPLWPALRGDDVPRYGLELLSIGMALAYAASGFAKLRHGGLGWLDGSTLQMHLQGVPRMPQLFIGPVDPSTVDAFRDGFGLTSYLYASIPTSLGNVVSTLPAACAALAVATVVIELGVPVLLLLGGRARRFGVVVAVGFHVGIMVLMNISFWSWIVVMLGVAELPPLSEQALRWWRARRAQRR